MSVHESGQFIDANTAAAASDAATFANEYIKVSHALKEVSGERPSDLSIEKAMNRIPVGTAGQITGEPIPYTLDQLIAPNPREKHDGVPSVDVFVSNGR